MHACDNIHTRPWTNLGNWTCEHTFPSMKLWILKVLLMWGLLCMCVERFIIRLEQGYGGWKIQGPALFKLETPGGWGLKAPNPIANSVNPSPSLKAWEIEAPTATKMDIPLWSGRIQPSSFFLFTSDAQQIGWKPMHPAESNLLQSVLRFSADLFQKRASPNNHVPASWSSLAWSSWHIENVLVPVSAHAIIKASFTPFCSLYLFQ